MNIYIAFLSIATLATASVASATVTYEESLRGLPDYVEAQSTPKSPAAMQFVDNDDAYLQLSADHKRIEKYETKTGKLIECVFSTDNTREITLANIEGFTISPEGSKLLVWTDSKEQYRHSFSAKYYFYEFRSRLLKPLSETNPRQHAPLFSPDGRMIAYVADNNIYVKKLDYGSDVAVTKDGKVNEIINGVPDWTYQEEFSTIGSMAWAPDNLTLCFLKYNEKEVPTYSIELYEGRCPEMKEYALYPGNFSYKYPVAGQTNSKVTAHSYNIETRKVLNLTLPDARIEYIPRIAYTPSAEGLMVVTMNRDQNRMEIYNVNPKSNIAKSILVEESKGWIAPESYEEITLMEDGFVLPSYRSGYRHYYRYSYNGALLGALTAGDYDVTDFYGFDEKGESIFYQAAMPSPINRTVVMKTLKNGKTVEVSPKGGYATARFSARHRYYIEYHSSATKVPVYTLIDAATRKGVRTLEDNAEYATKYASMPKPEFFTMESAGVKLNGYIIKPKNFDSSKCYPVVMSQYSGPGSQEVLDRWKAGFENYYATAGYVVACVDGRGTGGRGADFLYSVYKRLGYYETIDQVNAAKYIGALPFCDSSKIGIYGWSYGGYESIMAASHKDAPYAAAVAVAPVTDWRFYDTIYAERYMLTPEQNESGYNISSADTYAANRKCPLLIMSGTADDNVHFYNTVHYMTTLENHQKYADLMIFANANHSIRGCGRRTLVYARMLDYFNRNMR